jgi:hypothetical protein
MRSFSSCLLRLGFFASALVFVLSPAGAVQPPRPQPRPNPPRTPAILARHAGYVFVGRVLSVERLSATGPAVAATVRIKFRVEQAIRGVRKGETLVVREWAGLWQSGERYRTGERVALLLYSPSRLGLTSPVGGALGRFSVDSAGRIVVQPIQAPILSVHPSMRSHLGGKIRLSPREFSRLIRREPK